MLKSFSSTMLVKSSSNSKMQIINKRKTMEIVKVMMLVGKDAIRARALNANQSFQESN